MATKKSRRTPVTTTQRDKVIEKKISNLTEFTTFLEEEIKTTKANLWFRGCGNKEYKLLPSLYRTTGANQPDVRKKEVEIIDAFRQKSIIYLSQQIQQDWDCIFYMQHYGFPTRLLDWTENPFMALYFALKAWDKTSTNDAVVWMCKPAEWNKIAMSHLGVKSVLLPFDKEKVKGYKSDTSTENNLNAEIPAAIQGYHSNNRIIAQRGVFMIFGQSIKSMEEFFIEKDEFDINVLKKIIIPYSVVSVIRNSLRSIGFADTVVFPDIEGLAMEIKNEFGFEV